ncbi:hypothetical protein QYE76_027432 [Lolium multiflorum]|uniref:Uncharacterized protein n=1 Tax=Lolium multiflorum TaxID=4521 RepID=A0AAD8QKS1_LOLMU|nr:hypothetical protein QYE76_027432 [Lolium multiflorum]
MVELGHPVQRRPDFSFGINMAGPVHHHSNDKEEDSHSRGKDKEEAGLRDRPDVMKRDMASSINFNQFLEKEKLKSNGSNFTDWFRHNMNKEFSELFGMLKAAEIEIKKEHQVLMVNKTTSFKKQGKSKGKNKKSGKKAATPPVKPKSGPKPDADCKEKGHWKRNCSKYLADLKSGLIKKKKEVPNLRAIAALVIAVVATVGTASGEVLVAADEAVDRGFIFLFVVVAVADIRPAWSVDTPRGGVLLRLLFLLVGGPRMEVSQPRVPRAAS